MAISDMSLGMILVPRTTMAVINSAALSEAKPTAESPPEGLFIWGRITIKGMTARSCTISIPIITLLDKVPISPLFIRVFRITMVLEREMRAPNQIEDFQSQPIIWPIPYPMAIVSSIWMGVPIRAIFLTGCRSLRENSRPRANRSRATPISARSSISWILVIVRPPVCGPRITPAMM